MIYMDKIVKIPACDFHCFLRHFFEIRAPMYALNIFLRKKIMRRFSSPQKNYFFNITTDKGGNVSWLIPFSRAVKSQSRYTSQGVAHDTATGCKL